MEGSFVTITKGSVEFLNPSIKDFISGEIATNPERLTDLVLTSLRFEQLVTLWRWSRHSKASGPLAIIDAANEQFVSAVEASIARPYRRVISYENCTAEQQLDLYPEGRMAALLEMVDNLKSGRLLALVPTVVGSILERWKETVPNFEETTGILSFMENETWSQARLDRKLYETIRGRMLAELANACSFYDFVHVDEFLKTAVWKASDAENETFSVGFNIYIKSQFSWDLREVASSGEALDEMASFMSKMMTDYGYDISHEYGRVIETIAERDERAERRADNDYGWSKDVRGFEKADEEAISSMFDSLKASNDSRS